MAGVSAIAVVIALRSPGTHVPVWLAWVLGSVTVVALYMTFTSALGLPPARTRRAIQSAPPPAIEPLALIPLYDQSAAYRHRLADQGWIIEHRVGAYNPPGQPLVREAYLRLERLESGPRNVPEPKYAPKTPFLVPLLSGTDKYLGQTIGPGQQEYWIIGYTAVDESGVMTAGGFATDERGTPWRFDADERWRLSYRLTCDDGRPDTEFSIVVTAEDGQIYLRKEG